jgi:trimeric autotransporter adhesin
MMYNITNYIASTRRIKHNATLKHKAKISYFGFVTLILSLFLAATNAATAQVTIGVTNYTTLKAAFDDINSGVHTGSITILISGNTTETASCILNASGTGSTSYTDIAITPTGGATRLISGSVTGYLLDLSGAANVTIDGIGTAGDNLTIRNTATAASGAIRLINDATNNVIKNLRLEGSATTANNGVVLFSTGVATGNDNNQIRNCLITAAGTNLPLNAIVSLGTATAGLENSENLVQANQIFDFFNASASSRGVNLANGSTAWTVRGNNFYQTATRTYTTTGLTNIPILISTTTGSGFVVENNIIGYSNATGTGNYTITSTGTIAPQMAAISISTIAGATTSIQNNSISNINVTTSGGNTCFIGISLSGVGNYNVGTTTGNIIGSASTNNAIVGVTLTTGTIAASVAGILSSATGTVTISNNTIGGITGTGSATAACNIFALQVSGGTNTITFNTIGSTTQPNSINASNTSAINQTVVGINITSTVVASIVVTDNILSNLTQNSTGTTSTLRGIVSASTGNIIIARNTISNFNGFTANSTQGASGTCVQGIWVSANSVNSVIERNTIFSLAARNTGTVGTIVSAIGTSNPTDLVIAFNKIYDLKNASTSVSVATPGIAVGVLIRAAQVNGITVRNNMISLGTNETTNTMFVGVMNSFSAGNGPVLKLYHNSIHIAGASTGMTSSFCIYRGDLNTLSAISSNIDVRNNILNMARTSTGGAINFVYGNNYPNTTSPALTTGWGTNATNYNAINGANIGWWSSARAASAWKSITACDGNSVPNVPVTFVDPATADLHLNMGTTSTALESGGATIASITTDFDNDTRPGPSGSVNGGATAPDLGADEFDGVPGDLAPPVVTLVGVSSKDCSLTDRTFTASITDFTGVPTTGVLQPRVYYRKTGSATWSSAQGSLASGTAQNGTWSFTIAHAALGGVVVGEIIEYYVIAQDDTPTANIASNPGGVDAIDVNTITTTPSKLLNYQIAFPTISGTFQVGSVSPAPFNTLTNAIASFNNACAQTGAVVFELTDNNYSSFETFPLAIQKRPDASATNTFTIKPAAAVDVTISNATGANTISCRNNYTTIDGSNNGSNSQNLSILNVSSSSAGLVQFLSLGSNAPITNCTIKNTIVNNGSQNSSAIIIYDSTGVAGYFNNMTVQNNVIQRAFIGLYCQGTTALGNGSGLVVAGNNLTASGTNAIRLVGLYVQGIDGALVSNNSIGNFESVNAENDRGIWLATGCNNVTVTDNTITNMACNTASTGFAPIGINVTPTNTSGNIIAGNTITGLTNTSTGTTSGISVTSGSNTIIRANRIANIKNTNTGGWGSAGINVAATTTNIYNNFVSDIAAFGFDASGIADNGNGIVVSGGTGHSIYHNTVLMNTSQSAAGRPAALLVTSGVTGTGVVNIQNNIFVNTQTLAGERYAVVSGAPNTVFGTFDNNAYFTTGSNLGFIGTNRATLSDFRVGFGGNIASVIENPIFVSATDLHINTGTLISKLESGGTVITGFTTDIDNDARPGPTGSVNGGGYKPDLGADEFDGTPAPIVINAKAFLAHTDPVSALMEDYNRTLPNFPLLDPYSSAPFSTSLAFTHVNNPTVATIAPSVLTVTGNNAIVDWVFVELRTGSPSTVAQTKAALIQRDGDIVDTDGVSPFSILAPNNEYRMTIRHRHNFGFTTANDTLLSNNAPMTYNFTTNSVPLFGTFPITSLTPTVWVMNSGDANFDGSVDAFDTIDWEAQNGLFDDYTLNADYNMDGSVDALDSIIWEFNNGKFEEIP